LPLTGSLFLLQSLLALVFFFYFLLVLLKCFRSKDTLGAEELGYPFILLTQKVETLVLLPPLLLLGYGYL
jgi:hypothetical protein